MREHLSRFLEAALACALLAVPSPAIADDALQWGRAWDRNMVSDETGLPERIDPAAGGNLVWSVDLGTQSYASPIVAGGKVLIGTNNERPRISRHRGDRGVLLCLDDRDGRMQWQLTVPKASRDPYQDWPRCGICSPPTVEDGRAYVMTNRFEVVCLDLEGQANGNDGSADEGRFMAPEGVRTVPVKRDDADILWTFSLPDQAGTYRHDGAFSSALIDGRFLYLNSCNGVDNTHRKIRRPDAPSLVVLDKRTGRHVASDGERIGPRVFHSTWSPPSMGVVNGRKLIFFGGGDGVCYAFEALAQDTPLPGDGDKPRTLKRVWKFDCDPTGPKQDVSQYLGNRKQSPSTIVGMPVFCAGKVFVASGGDLWWGKRESRMQCIDASGSGDVTASACKWTAELGRHCFATPAIHDGLVYIGDCGRNLHCIEAETGRSLWTHPTTGDVWAGPLVADGKVYVGSRSGDFHILSAGREKKVLCSVKLDSPVSCQPTAANGRLYVVTMRRLYVFGDR
jgi:outer membrane protein assembly factor BamB